MNDIQIFNNPEFGELRTVEKGGKIFFVASDVAKMLGYKNISDAVSRHCRYIVKRDIPHPQGKGTLTPRPRPPFLEVLAAAISCWNHEEDKRSFFQSPARRVSRVESRA